MNRKKKTEKIAAEALLIIILAITVLLIVATGCNSKDTHKDAPTLNYQYTEWESYIDSTLNSRLDAVMDSMNMECGGEYHGKEGKSEYGEYNGN